MIATADRPRFLEGAVRSVLASADQAAPAVRSRVLVVDDAESGSAERVARAAGVDYLRNPIRDGRRNPSAARAWGLQQVETEVVALFDDDDLMLDDHIERLAAHIAAGADVVSTGYWYAEPDPEDPTRLVPLRRQLLREPRLGDLLRGFQSVNDQSMLRTDVARSVEWDPERENTMMYHVWLQLLLDGRRFVANRSATFLYRQHPTSLSHTLDEHDGRLRERLLAESTTAAVARFGSVPGPSWGVRMRLLKGRFSPAWGAGRKQA